MKQTRLILAFLMLAAGSYPAVNYTYDPAGRLVTVDYGNGATITYTYDNAGNVVSKTVTPATSKDAPKPASSKKPEKKDPPKSKQ